MTKPHKVILTPDQLCPFCYITEIFPYNFSAEVNSTLKYIAFILEIHLHLSKGAQRKGDISKIPGNHKHRPKCNKQCAYDLLQQWLSTPFQLSTEDNKKEDKPAFKRFSMSEQQLKTIFKPSRFAGL